MAPRLPGALVVRGLASQAPLFEQRVYRTSQDLAGVLRRAGIHPALSRTVPGGFAYLIPFESLTQRQRAWTALEADPHWNRIRPGIGVSHISIYRRAGISV